MYALIFFFWFWQKFCQFVLTEIWVHFESNKIIPTYFVKKSHWSAVIRTFEERQSVINHTHQIRPEWTSLHDCTSWPFCPQDGLCFSSSSSPYVNQHSTSQFVCLLTFDLSFWANFSPTLTLHTTLQPSYPTNLPTLLTYLLA